MSERSISLDVIGVASPCHEDWSGMDGGERERFCDSCEKHVHNLSAMTRAEAESFVNANPKGACVRFYRDTQGKVITADQCETEPEAAARRVGRSLPRSQGGRRRAGHIWLPFMSMFTAMSGLAALWLGGGERAVPPGPCIMGDIAVPVPAPVPVAPVRPPAVGPEMGEVEILMGGIMCPEPVVMGLIAVPPQPAPPAPVEEPEPQPVEEPEPVEPEPGDASDPV